MITARNLLQNAVHLLTQRPQTTLAVIAPALLLMCGVSAVTARLAPGLLRIGADSSDIATLTQGVVPLGLVAGFILSYALMAVLWHRHTLSDRAPLKPLGLRLAASYLWRVVLLAFIQLIASVTMVVPLMVLSKTGVSGFTSPSLSSILLVTLISQTAILWLLLRLSLILPAAALGTPMPMARSWKHTAVIMRPLWGVAIALALVNALCTALTTLLNLTAPAQTLFLELPTYILEGLLIFSILTTLYARLVLDKKSSVA